jgi:ABC-type uncharacterized transport system YnjBCD ATPase subunit
VLLLDEPLSNLDPTLRERTRREIREVIHGSASRRFSSPTSRTKPSSWAIASP